MDAQLVVSKRRRGKKGYRNLFKRPKKGCRPHHRRAMLQHNEAKIERKPSTPITPATLTVPNFCTTTLAVTLIDCVKFPSLFQTPKVKQPIRVLSLFDGLGTTLYALDKLKIEVGIYYSSEIDPNAISLLDYHYHGRIVMLGGVQKITPSVLQSLGRIDLLTGASPCAELSLVNPKRRGIHDPESSGYLFHEFVRVKDWLYNSAQENNYTFHWLFENTSAMEMATKTYMTKKLACDPVLLCASQFVPMKRKRLFWGNVPGLHNVTKTSQFSHTLQSFLKAGRLATVTVLPTLTTSTASQKQGSLPPVTDNGKSSLLLVTEQEALFGFEKSWTDNGQLSITDRRKLLGKSWQVHVIEAIFRPLTSLYNVAEGK